MADQQTYAEWLKANPAPNFAALIARHGSYEAIPRKFGRHLPMPSLNGNAVGGCAVRIGRSQSLRKHLRRHFCDLKYTSPRTTLPMLDTAVERTT